jgi:hypothetical protein
MIETGTEKKGLRSGVPTSSPVIPNRRRSICMRRWRNPANLGSHVYMAAAAAVAAGDREMGEWEVDEILSRPPGFAMEEWLETSPMTDAGQIWRLTTTLGSLGLRGPRACGVRGRFQRLGKIRIGIRQMSAPGR